MKEKTKDNLITLFLLLCIWIPQIIYLIINHKK